MITFDQATAKVEPFYAYKDFEHATRKNSDGTPERWRRNGKTKTWKTRPGHFQIPVKRGLYEYGYITHENAHEFHVA